MNIEGFIFDLDGTIIDSMTVWHSLGKIYVKSLGIYEENEDLSKKMFTMSVDGACSFIKENFSLSQSVEEIKEGLINIIRDFYKYEAKAKPGAVEFIKSVYGKVPMVIATATDRELLMPALERLDLLKYFDNIYTCGELDTNKTMPKIFNVAVDFMKTDISKTCVMEDSLYSIKTAKKMGFITVGIEDTESIPDKDEIKSLVDFYIEDYENDSRAVIDLVKTKE